jgi:putative addiction module component (TIGR02574 family)
MASKTKKVATAKRAATTTASAKRSVFKHALSLPPDERAALAHELIASLDGPPGKKLSDSEWLQQLDRRSLELQTGKVKAEPWESVQARTLENLKRRRARSG